MSHLSFLILTAGQTFWPAVQLFFLYFFSIKESKQQQTGSSILKMVTEYFSSTALTFYLLKAFSVRDVQQGILPAGIDSGACKWNIYLWSEHIAPTSCHSVQRWSSLIDICLFHSRELQVCCTYCQWLSSRLRHTFSMRLSIKQFYPF